MRRPVRLLASVVSVVSVACSSGSSPALDAGEPHDGGVDGPHLTPHDGAAGRDVVTRDVVSPFEAAPPRDVSAPDVHDAHPSDVRDASLPDVVSPPVDAGADAQLGGCRGASMTVTIDDQGPYLDVPIGGEKGEFLVDFGSTFSSIDLSTFPSPGPTTSGCDANELGEDCTVAGFDFFGVTASVVLVTESYGGSSGGFTQSGIVGTDLLAQHVVTLDYAGGEAYAAPQASACSASALEGAGFVALSAAGFYENDMAKLKPASDVESGASSGETVPDVPTVPVSIAGVSAVAQLDTGFDDDVTPFSVNIDKAFYSAIVAAMPSALVRDVADDETLTTCVDGVSENAEAYRMASGVTFDFVGTSGTAARSYAQAVIFVKETPEAAESCGGIGTWSVPAAQVGASFYVDMKRLVFDPFGATVWMPAP